MLRTEEFSKTGELVGYWDLDGTDVVHVVHGETVERRPATPEELVQPTSNPTPDLPALANQVATLNDAVNQLILSELGV